MLEQLSQFIINHWLLSSALLLTLALLFWEETKNNASGLKLSLSDATNLINRERATWIDVRDAKAYQDGHITNALNFPHADILNQLEKLKKYRDKPLILIDDAGHQTNTLANKLRKQGFSKTYALIGGLQTWKNNGLPLLTKT